MQAPNLSIDKKMPAPIVLIPACSKQIGHHPWQAVQLKYLEAVVYGAGCVPLIIPALGEQLNLDALLAVADGVMLTGSPSNIHPEHFGQAVHNPALPLDPARDAITLPLVRATLQRSIPLLAICRGMQEVNVALGGSLHQAVQEVSGMMDHRDDDSAPLEIQYGAAHAVSIRPGGRLAMLLGETSTIMVNSLHGQGVDRLAAGLQIEAQAPDGLIEAFSVSAAAGFTLAVQWHPEWQVRSNPVSMKIFGGFGAACQAYQQGKVAR